MTKRKDIHFRIEEKLLERFELALHYEGLKKTDVLTHAIQQFCTKVECEKMNDVKRQYNVSNHLQTRINTHKHYEEKHVNLDEVVMDHLQLQGDEKILEVGCANGSFLSLLQTNGHTGHLTGLDQSKTMLSEATIKNSIIEWRLGDAGKLPFEANCYDWIVARHMLYHMKDVEKTIQGFHKVIRPGGTLLATTNSSVTLPRIVEMCNRMLDAFALPKTISSVTPFCLENGKEILQSVFPTVEETVIHNALVFHHATPIVNYISSMFPSLNIPDNMYLQAEMKEWLTEEINQELSLHNGIWRDPKTLVIYRCQKEKS
ncbi:MULTISPECIES: methyltransferase domain-containing protein [Bacillus cereus group]|uniref:Methyltransferase n=1 Tax=Bacillus cereus VD133 TaxID=1053233 RepID=A0A9W5PPY8_BACCE|nr:MULTISPECIES: methyltransferase domain-containing protein [Bacillus cereus group]EOO32575.1 methyltransferase [Bacillus cereus VD133]MCR6786341.1 methyltransferase domain-containing protein [Bacillus thuringiensis]MCR6823974.1 methyltransferase domain-containing protein [Bacillus thuringiensis]MCR6828417.1 methyltransferase domain-containing protein [Bacillus thuringiensis]MEB8929596.1 methyltransferase domain-containing protein [Bacillus cereus]